MMTRLKPILFTIYLVIWAALAVNPLFREDWLLENMLVFVSVPLIVWLDRRYGFSNESAVYLFIFMSLHAVGSHYTYSHVPFLNGVWEALDMSRNHFDRLAHFLFGYLFMLPMYDVIRKSGTGKRAALALAFFMLVSFSGLYEVGEWAVATLTHSELGIAFLGVQGDVWDAQKDMALAFCGNILGLLRSMYVANRRV